MREKERVRERERKHKERVKERERKGIEVQGLYQYMYMHTIYVPRSIIDNKCGTLNNVTYSCKRQERARKIQKREGGLRDRELYQYTYINVTYVPGSIIDNKCGTLNTVT